MRRPSGDQATEVTQSECPKPSAKLEPRMGGRRPLAIGSRSSTIVGPTSTPSITAPAQSHAVQVASRICTLRKLAPRSEHACPSTPERSARSKSTSSSCAPLNRESRTIASRIATPRRSASPKSTPIRRARPSRAPCKRTPTSSSPSNFTRRRSARSGTQPARCSNSRATSRSKRSALPAARTLSPRRASRPPTNHRCNAVIAGSSTTVPRARSSSATNAATSGVSRAVSSTCSGLRSSPASRPLAMKNSRNDLCAKRNRSSPSRTRNEPPWISKNAASCGTLVGSASLSPAATDSCSCA
ncbi:hypothetical protein ENSA7_73480 [Enhygromyxa salina]|uniref:Uncharacterized protein n=1 Tax=Enhygromyxa salina TaxID=215803 RepID=A0A2S9XS71_9BACT|nr:hypothetical protein ENSA7_73480 [Enhygromyxa salina]